tara:strand:- start:612 stop:773 length:162 start_codon:yes stop_codon:yes gene_type:complete
MEHCIGSKTCNLIINTLQKREEKLMKALEKVVEADADAYEVTWATLKEMRNDG